ncbi:hypothetical protein [Paraglaciecola mesophila]|jgi:hypothetical protein
MVDVFIATGETTKEFGDVKNLNLGANVAGFHRADDVAIELGAG